MIAVINHQSTYTVKSIYPHYDSKTYKNIKKPSRLPAGAAIALSLAVTVRDQWPWNYLGSSASSASSAMAGSAEGLTWLF
jgi:hypothetical protein